MRQTRAWIAKLIRAMRILAKDERVPKPVRWLAGISLLPIPGPFDEALLILVAPVLLVFYRGPLRDAWAGAVEPAPPDQAGTDSAPSARHG
jgi:hypothetical protein